MILLEEPEFRRNFNCKRFARRAKLIGDRHKHTLRIARGAGLSGNAMFNYDIASMSFSLKSLGVFQEECGFKDVYIREVSGTRRDRADQF